MICGGMNRCYVAAIDKKETNVRENTTSLTSSTEVLKQLIHFSFKLKNQFIPFPRSGLRGACVVMVLVCVAWALGVAYLRWVKAAS